MVVCNGQGIHCYGNWIGRAMDGVRIVHGLVDTHQFCICQSWPISTAMEMIVVTHILAGLHGTDSYFCRNMPVWFVHLLDSHLSTEPVTFCTQSSDWQSKKVGANRACAVYHTYFICKQRCKS